jgi:hypothetical protein
MRGAGRIVLALMASVFLATAVGTAGAASFGNVTCKSGTIKAGSYHSLTITGLCTLPSQGTISVARDLTVARHAAFNGISMATLKVGGDVVIQNDAVAGIGCAPDVGCPGFSTTVVNGSVKASGAWAVILHSMSIKDGLNITGGGGSMDCSSTALFGGPYYVDLSHSSVGGNAVMKGVHSCWLGFISNTIGGNATIQGNRLGDPDAVEIVTNTIGGNLGCFNNVPQAHVGDSGGSPNVVGGQKRGECKNL